MTKKISIIVRDAIKWLIILNMCTTIVSNPEPKLGGELYAKMCSMFKLPRLCWPYILNMNSYAYPFYSLPLSAVPVPLPVAPFPLIVNPTTPSAPFTIPPVFTPSGPQRPPSGPGPIAGPSSGPISGPPIIQIPSGGGGGGPICPPAPPICPPAVLTTPIDPRQGIILCLRFILEDHRFYNQNVCFKVLRQFNGCPCIDPRVAPGPGLAPPGFAGPLTGGGGGGSGPGPQMGPIPAGGEQRSARLIASHEFPRLSRAIFSQSKQNSSLLQ